MPKIPAVPKRDRRGVDEGGSVTRSALESLHPSVVLQFAHQPPPRPSSVARWRGKIRRQVSTCTDCELAKTSGHPPVPYHGPSPARFVVIGEAPGPEEVVRGEPFVGASGRLLRTLMREAEIDVDEVLFANTVSCFPNVEGTIRKPSVAETAACRDNMFCQIEAGWTPYVLLVGASAFGAFRSDLNVTNQHGQVYVWNDTYAVMGTIHPAAVMRGQRHFKKMIREDLERWRDVVYSGDDPTTFLGTKCVKCDGEARWWDRDGVPWCTKHFEMWGEQWKKERARFNQVVEQLTF